MRTQLPEQTNVASTLGRGPQRIATAVLAAERTRLERKGVHNAAIVVVEHGSRSVVAMVGGHEGWGSEHGAWIAAFDVPRSPGSTLKPFLFARAIDRGLVLPGTRVPDVPTTHGGYTPRNYDGLFRGTVRLDHALSQSLNLPFVDLLAQVGVVDLVGLLRSAGAPSLSPDPSRYGLSLAVGGTEITPLELASLYTTLARDGKAAPLDWHGDRSATTGLPVLSPGATWLTTRVLAQRDRPDFPRRAELAGRSPVLRWKTGTSQGHRDAWAAGYGQRYTAVVWLGNLDGTASRALVGGELAAPVLFDLITALERNEGPSPGHDGAPPEDLVEVRVCPLSGLPVGPACPHAEEALALRSSVPTETCDLHRELEIDAASGERVEPGCRSGRVTRREVFVVEPPSVRRWKTTRGMAGATLPPMAKDCSNAASHAPPRILHPREGTVLVLLPDLEPTHQEQPLIAEADHPEPLWWFVDGRIVAHADADERAWWTPSPGRHELVVMATSGRADRRWVEVREGM